MNRNAYFSLLAYLIFIIFTLKCIKSTPKQSQGKLQLINKSQNNITKWELWQTNISPDLAVMQAIDAGDHEVCVGDYDLRVYFNDGRTEYCKKVSVRQNKPTVVEIV